MHPYLHIPGWMKLDQLQAIAKLAESVPANGSILEIGAFFGRCTRVLGRHKPVSASLFTIEHWENLPSHVFDGAPVDVRGTPENLELIQAYSGDIPQADAHRLWKHFVGDIPNATHQVAYSQEIFPLGNFDLIIHDGSHVYQEVLTDLENWYPTMNPGGRFIIDDYSSLLWQGVRQAVDEFVDENDLELQEYGAGLFAITGKEND